MMIISIDKLTKWYGTQLVLDELSYDLSEPAIIALVAPNGSGKTTLLNIICELERPSGGVVKIFDYGPRWQQFQQVSFMQDNSVLFGHLSGLDHLRFVAGNHQLSEREILAVTESLKMTGYLKKKVKNYSLGMKQHLLFAMAILPKPRLLLLDEPLNGLDPASIVRVRELMLQLHLDNDMTIIFSSHNLEQIDKLTDTVIFLKDGELIESLPVFADYQFVVAELAPLEDYLSQAGLSYTVLGPHKLSCRLIEKELADLEQYCLAQALLIFDKTIMKVDTESLYFDLFREEDHGA